jgi:hypothetical protein
MVKRIGAGAGAGLLGGLVLGLLMRVLPVSTSEGNISMITFAARAIRIETPWAGWLAYLAYAIAVGALFGLALRPGTSREGLLTLLGGVWGLGWCVVAGLALIPTLFGVKPFSTMAIQQAREIAVPIVVGHVAYGIVLGAAFGFIAKIINTPGKPGSAVQGMRRAA